MTFAKLAAAGLMLALAGTAAGAFEEQKAGGVVPAGDAPAAAAAPDAGLGLDAGKSGAAGEAGTEVNIPGLGKLGVLPKMDFGLELLYGVGESKAQPQPETPAEPEDLTIRGTVKHKF